MQRIYAAVPCVTLQLIRLYGGSWRRCFISGHRANQRAEIRVSMPNFASVDAEKIVSDTFSIGDHRFCLWIFPDGNPKEDQYTGKVLSVYLVLTDLHRRQPDWLTCAVFSLSVENHADPSKSIEWHSCLVDNKFDSQLNNWGVHSLGALKTLKEPSNGFLNNGTLSVTANVRLMTITFRVVFERHMRSHHQLGLADLSQVETIVLPFCCTLQDLLKKLHDTYQLDPATVNVWCFNQPVVSGQALRPRKLLTQAKVNSQQPMFGNLLCDGVDVDAYSFCQLYVEAKGINEDPLDIAAAPEMSRYSSSPAPSRTASAEEASDATDMEVDDEDGYLFVKVLNPCTNQLEYIGRMQYAGYRSTASIYECVAHRLSCSSSELLMFKEEIAPTIFSGPILWSHDLALQQGFECELHPADIVIFVLKSFRAETAFVQVMQQLLASHYEHALQMLQLPFAAPTLEQIEHLAEKLDIPKFRVRSAFRKCQEDGRRTLKYIMEGRHLGFICDSCGETDFKGPRYNCAACSDYDLCKACNSTWLTLLVGETFASY